MNNKTFVGISSLTMIDDVFSERDNTKLQFNLENDKYKIIVEKYDLFERATKSGVAIALSRCIGVEITNNLYNIFKCTERVQSTHTNRNIKF